MKTILMERIENALEEEKNQNMDDSTRPLEGALVDQLKQEVLAAPAQTAISSNMTASNLVYYKDERLLTLYSFEALQAAGNAAWAAVMKKAFGDSFPGLDDESIGAPDVLQYERQLSESNALRAYLRERYLGTGLPHPDGLPHPVLYINRWAHEKLRAASDPKEVHFEGPTHVDVCAQWNQHEAKPRLYGEAKFMADVSDKVKYWACRNQIARTIEAGLHDCAVTLAEELGHGTKRTKIRKNAIDRFYFILITPALFKERHRNARLYGYLMDEYMAGPDALQRDLGHVVHLHKEDWARVSKRLGWVTWEDIHDAMAETGGEKLPDWEALQAFYADRGVFPKEKICIRWRFRTSPLYTWEEVRHPDGLVEKLRAEGRRNFYRTKTNPLTDGLSHVTDSKPIEKLTWEDIRWAAEDTVTRQLTV